MGVEQRENDNRIVGEEGNKQTKSVMYPTNRKCWRLFNDLKGRYAEDAEDKCEGRREERRSLILGDGSRTEDQSFRR